jgi:hypothetical protein
VLVTPPNAHDKSDAIQLALEHCGGEAADVFLPYQLDAGGALRYGEMFSCTRDAQFFNQL